MNVKELRGALQRIEDTFSAAGATAVAKDLRSIASLLDGHDEQSVEAFIAETRSLLQKPASTQRSPLNAECVEEHASNLLSAGIEQAAFEEALLRVVDDKRVGKAEWAHIANRYRNAPTNGTHVSKFETIKAAKAAIRDAFIERHEASSKRGIIDRITKWAS